MASGTIKAVATTNLSQTFATVSFSITTSTWVSSSGTYSATVTSSHITSSSKEFIEFDASLRNALLKDVNCVKASGNNGVTFSTTAKPVATLSGKIYVLKV